MISYALSTMQLTVTVTDAAGDPVIGAAVQILTVTNVNGDPVAGTWPLDLDDVSDGTYTWTYTDEFRLALGTGSRFTMQLEAVFDGATRYAEVPIQVRVDRT
jgi:hypothetical protein